MCILSAEQYVFASTFWLQMSRWRQVVEPEYFSSIGNSFVLLYLNRINKRIELILKLTFQILLFCFQRTDLIRSYNDFIISEFFLEYRAIELRHTYFEVISYIINGKIKFNLIDIRNVQGILSMLSNYQECGSYPCNLFIWKSLLYILLIYLSIELLILKIHHLKKIYMVRPTMENFSNSFKRTKKCGYRNCDNSTHGYSF